MKKMVAIVRIISVQLVSKSRPDNRNAYAGLKGDSRARWRKRTKENTGGGRRDSEEDISLS